MNSHPIWCALLRMFDRHLQKRAFPSNSKISCKPSFPTRLPALCLSSAFPTAFCSLFCPHRSHNLKRHTSPSRLRTLFQWPADTHISLSWRGSNHFSRHGANNDALPAVNYITCITTPQKPLIFTASWPPLFFALPHQALGYRAQPPPDTPITHFFRPTQLQPSLSAGFRDIYIYIILLFIVMRAHLDCCSQELVSVRSPP